ncbi:MAG: hypothetical protein K0Q72_1578 [Armatimonadetes bacterium]|jgi:hypothetical protein|nr:hypothetical protein [Armatimonadota bacterium]
MVWSEVNQTAANKGTRRNRAASDEITWGSTLTWAGSESASASKSRQPKPARVKMQSRRRNLKPAGLLTLLFGLGR